MRPRSIIKGAENLGAPEHWPEREGECELRELVFLAP